jgi:hypothetical protein
MAVEVPLWLSLLWLLLVATGVRRWFLFAGRPRAGVVVTNVYRHYRITWSDVHGVDVQFSSSRDSGDESRLRFYSAPTDDR